MSIIICTNSKNYALTVGKEYVVIAETRDLVTVENNKKVLARYSKLLFKDKVLEVETIAPVAPVEPKVFTLEEIKNQLSVSVEDDDGDYLLELEYIDENEWSETVNTTIEYSDSIISCGVKEVSGINLLAQFVKSFINKLDLKQLTEENQNELMEYLFNLAITASIAEIKENSLALLLLSTNITNNEYSEVITKVLDDKSKISTEAVNPNSDNTIKLWVIDCTN